MGALSQIHSTLIEAAIVPIVVNNDTEGKGLGIDLRGAEACQFVAHVGDSGDTLSGTVWLALRLEHADPDGAGADPADGDYTAVLDPSFVVLDDGVVFDEATGNFAVIDAPAEDQAVFRAAYVGDKAFARLIVDTTGTHTNGTPISALAVKGHLRQSVGGAVAV